MSNTKNGFKTLSFILYLASLITGCFLSVFSNVPSVSSEIITAVQLGFLVLALAVFIISFRRIKAPVYVIFTMAFLLLAVLQTYNVLPDHFLTRYHDYIVVIISVMLCIIPLKERSEERLKALKIGVLVFVLMVLVVDVLSIRLMTEGQTEGIFSNQNLLGNYNAFLAVTAISCFILGKKKLVRVVSALLFIVSFIFIILNTSRGALLILIAYIAVLFLIYAGRNFSKHKDLFASILVIIVVTAMAAVKVGVDYFNSGDAAFSSFINRFMTGRINIWFNVYPALMKGHWILGNGITNGAIRSISENRLLYATVPDGGTNLVIIHNVILDLLCQGGLVGLVIFVIALIALIVYIKKNVDMSLTENKVYVAVVIALMAHYMLDLVFIWGNNIHIFLILGLLLGNIKEVAYEE